jgi:putative nucleotidyltransferase with HDIG domain
VYGLAAAAEGRESWWRGWRSLVYWAAPHYALWGFVAGLMAVAYRRAELVALAAFAVPLLALRETQSAIVRRAQASADDLRDATEAIQAQTISLERVQRLLREKSAGAIEGLCAIVEARDPYSAGHSQRVREWALLIGRELGMSVADLETLGQAALFHDIGKLAVPDSILTQPGSLTADEWILMRKHPEEGARIIERFGFREDAVAAVRHHHERVDGRGYPDGLRGDDIPLAARIIHVANAYDSMRSNRVYRSARTESEAREELQRWAGMQFCPICVGAFERALEEGPQWRHAATEPVS